MDPKWSNEDVEAGWEAWRSKVEQRDSRTIMDAAMKRVMTKAVALFAARGPGMTLARIGEALGTVHAGAEGWSEAAEKIEAAYVGLLAKVVELEAQLPTHDSYCKEDAARGGPLSETEVAEELERITSLGADDRALARYRISVHIAAQGAMLEAQGTDLTASRGTQRVLMEERDATLARVSELEAKCAALTADKFGALAAYDATLKQRDEARAELRGEKGLHEATLKELDRAEGKVAELDASVAHAQEVNLADLRRHEQELEALRISARDDFARSALQGLVANSSRSGTIEGDAKRAYDYADAMLAERGRRI